MTALNFIKNKVKNLYETNPNIHINLSMSHPKVCVKMTRLILSEFTKMYSELKNTTEAFPKVIHYQYIDVLTKQIEIAEIQFSL